VVATRTGALPQVLGDAAAFVEPGDIAGLAAALSDVMADPAKRGSLIDRGRARAARYSWDACAEGLIHLYERLC
jgi:glycosyltransferase involved in cell wall biosynthesis